MRVLVALATLFAGACCTSLPKMPEKEIPLPVLMPEYTEIDETAEVWHDGKRNRDVPVKIYAPRDARTALPVVVFSHGIGEDRDSYAWLGRALAQHGYLTVHVTHAGTDRAVLERGYLHLYRAVKQPENWINRPLDVSFVLDRLSTRADADVQRTAAVGHSAGAFTAFMLAGMTAGDGNRQRDERVKVAIPISMPRMDGIVPPGGYGTVEVPVLNMTGTCDTSLIYRTFPKHRRIPWEEWRRGDPACAERQDCLPSTESRAGRQYLVTLEGATHDSFVIEDRTSAAIRSLVIACLHAYLRGDAGQERWFGEAGLTQIGGVRISVE
jgi:pimeloyl-ACP methyl ester carboxylesterase